MFSIEYSYVRWAGGYRARSDVQPQLCAAGGIRIGLKEARQQHVGQSLHVEPNGMSVQTGQMRGRCDQHGFTRVASALYSAGHRRAERKEKVFCSAVSGSFIC